jgi:Protein of unknown function (DUF2955)
MTAQVSQGGAAPVPIADMAVLARHRRMLRLALGTTLSFVTAEMLDWELSFVITAFLVQFLTAPGRAPSLRQGIAIVLVLGLATGTAATLSGLLVDMPALFAIVLGLMLFLAFVLQRSGRSPAAATLILVGFGLIPVLAVQAPDQVPAVAYYLVRSGAVAVLWVWLLHALLPDPEAAMARAPAPERAAASSEVARAALTDTAVLLPVLLVAMAFEVPAALVIVLTVTAVLRQNTMAGGQQVALGLLLGNLMGGLTAVVTYELLSAVPTLGFLTALLFLVSLSYACLIVGATSLAPLFVTALVTFVIVLGMGVAPFLDEPGATLAIRLRNLAIACVYAFAALSLIGRAGRPSLAGEARDA